MQFKTVLLTLAPLTLLAACGSGTDTAGGAVETQAPIAPIAAPAGTSWTDKVTRTAEGGYVLGNPDAPIKLVEYASLTCSHCAEFAETAYQDLVDKYVATGRVSYEIRNFVRDPIDLTASMLVRCGPDTSFYPLAEQMFANQGPVFEKAQGLGQDRYEQILALPDQQRYATLADAVGLIDFFSARGISRDQAAQCLANADTANKLASATSKAAEELNIQGTPTFFINNKQVDFTGWPGLQSQLQAMGAR